MVDLLDTGACQRPLQPARPDETSELSSDPAVPIYDEGQRHSRDPELLLKRRLELVCDLAQRCSRRLCGGKHNFAPAAVG